ncbi:TatD family hydrolase [Polaribacter sp. BAL334]|uniref:TatD family hydrolase n=1 Tax=Polaribacter sp. BAL334 TaxID=1708178 RepID=UPI0018D2688D|nr:TatD family hydrolase [Polaribacter sp. BAL334]MBG7613510.1 TatD family hydrolase [Polaribacter sp. BAL334]
MSLFLDIHTHSTSSSHQVFAIQNKYPSSDELSTPFSVGIHPWFLKKETFEIELFLLEEKLQHENCYAIGECGLDKAIDVDFDFQKEVFIQQIHLSEKYQKPMILHCVRAFQEIIELKKQFSPKQTWILHGFQKSKQLAESFLFNGIFLSFGEAVLSKSDLQNVILDFPLEYLLIETDNSEVSIALIYQKIAAIKNIEIEVLKEKIQANFNTIFKK